MKSYLLELAFLVIALALLALNRVLQGWGFDFMVLMTGNFLVFAITWFAFRLHKNALLAGNTTSFLKNAYLAMFGKLLFCVGAMVFYLLLVKDRVNKPSLFACLLFYFLYSFFEMKMLQNINQKRKDAGKRI